VENSDLAGSAYPKVSGQRILIIGSPGAGKTTFSKRLAQDTGLPLFHLDEMFWQAGWVEQDKGVFDKILREVLVQNQWIIDGNYKRTLAERLKYADSVYFLDIGRWRATYRILKRWLMREGLQAEGCPQRADLAFVKFVFWTFPRRDRQRIIDLLDQHKDLIDVRVI
jgi:adenylate kinase family enzyme